MANRIDPEEKDNSEIDELVNELEDALEHDADIQLPVSGEKGWGD